MQSLGKLGLALGVLLGALATSRADEVVARDEPLLNTYEPNDRVFVRFEVDDRVSYFYQRTVGDIRVEGDFIRYQFDLATDELVEHIERWRADVAEDVEPVLSRQDAEARAPGTVELSYLVFIRPGSPVHPVEPTPTNPCWVVRSSVDERPVVTILDAVTGQDLGRGVPPPYEGYALAGPDWGSCDPYYTPWAENAEDWFEDMGYNTQMQDTPDEAVVQARVGSDDIAVFYELAHGNSYSFHHNCPDTASITAGEIESWITPYANMPFTFLGSCEGACDIGDGTLSYEFRKGVDFGSAVVGYCQMQSTGCQDCWPYSIDWQDVLFDYLDQSYRVGYAFNQANLAYPVCANSACMHLVGDSQLFLVPNVRRAYCGDVYNGQLGPFIQFWRPYHLSCDVTVPAGQTLTIGEEVTVAFLGDARLTGEGTITADAVYDPILFAREQDLGAGLRLDGGDLRIYGGGQISIRDPN